MAITAAGAGSGLDIENIVRQLMTLERRPLDLLEQKEKDTQAQVSAYGTLKSAISTFQDAMKKLGTLEAFRTYATASSDEDVITATADADAAAGVYNLAVTRLAQNHKMGSEEFAETDMFGGKKNDALSLAVGAESITIDLSSGKTLAEVRDAINSAADNPGVTATILNTGDGNQRLILTADDSGFEKHIELSYGGTIKANTLGFATTNQDGQGNTLTDLADLDASYSIDGFALTSATNTIGTVIDGLSFELKGVGAANLNVSRDLETVEASAQEFVDAYNALLKTVKDLQGDELKGDSSLRGVLGQLRGVLNAGAGGLLGTFTSLSQVGIKSDAKTGEFVFNSADFKDALALDFSAVSELFANDDQGFAFRFEKLADRLLEQDGFIDLRVDSLNDRIRRFQTDQERMEWRLEVKEKALRAQYSALDSLVGSLQATSNFLFAQLGA